MKNLLLAAVALAIATPASAATIDPYAQLNSPTPTVGNFVFGTVNPGTGSITQFTNFYTPCNGFAATCGTNTTPTATVPIAYAVSVAGLPIPSVTAPTDRVLFHPSNDAFAGLAFFAALAGTYNFVGEFSIQQVNASGVDVGAVSSTGLNLLPSQFLISGSRSFDFTTSLAAGQSVSFFVGPAGTFNSDTTGLLLRVSDVAAVVAAVPEPSTWLMMILGFGLVGGTLRSRRRIKPGLAAA